MAVSRKLWSIAASMSTLSNVSFTDSESVPTETAGKPMPTLPCQPKCFTMAVSAFATVDSSASSRGIVMTSSMSSPVLVSTGAARSARAEIFERRMSYTPRMFRRSLSAPLLGGLGARAADSSPPALVAGGVLAIVGTVFAASPAAFAFSAFSAAIFARRSSAAFAARSSSSSTGGGFSLHSPSRSVQLPSPFSSMLIRPSASNPSAALLIPVRFLLTILYAISAAPDNTGSFASLNNHPMPVISYSAVRASMPVTTAESSRLITWIVSMAASNVIPSFRSGEYFGSAMSSNLSRRRRIERTREEGGGTRGGTFLFVSGWFGEAAGSARGARPARANAEAAREGVGRRDEGERVGPRGRFRDVTPRGREGREGRDPRKKICGSRAAAASGPGGRRLRRTRSSRVRAWT